MFFNQEQSVSFWKQPTILLFLGIHGIDCCQPTSTKHLSTTEITPKNSIHLVDGSALNTKDR